MYLATLTERSGYFWCGHCLPGSGTHALQLFPHEIRSCCKRRINPRAAAAASNNKRSSCPRVIRHNLQLCHKHWTRCLLTVRHVCLHLIYTIQWDLHLIRMGLAIKKPYQCTNYQFYFPCPWGNVARVQGKVQGNLFNLGKYEVLLNGHFPKTKTSANHNCRLNF